MEFKIQKKGLGTLYRPNVDSRTFIHMKISSSAITVKSMPNY